MTYYTRHQILELFDVDEGFLVALEREEIIQIDAPGGAPGEFSEQMLERVRVAHNLVHDLDVNLPGAGIIIRLREELSTTRRQMEELLTDLRRSRKG